MFGFGADLVFKVKFGQTSSDLGLYKDEQALNFDFVVKNNRLKRYTDVLFTCFDIF